MHCDPSLQFTRVPFWFYTTRRSWSRRHLSDRVLSDEGKLQRQISNTQMHHDEHCFTSLCHRGFKLKAVIRGALGLFDCLFFSYGTCAAVDVGAMILNPNGSCSLPVELNYISSVLMEHQITLWAFLSCICSGRKMWCDNEQGFHKQWIFLSGSGIISPDTWQWAWTPTTERSVALTGHNCGPRAPTDTVAWLDPIRCRLVMYAGIVLDRNTRQTVCRLNTAACFTHPQIMSVRLLPWR